MSFKIDLSGKTVLITGVSSGIGAAIAEAYASANGNIAGCALEADDHPGVQQFITTVKNASGKTPLYIQTDVTKLGELEIFIQRVIDHYGRIDILASNAGANVFKGAKDCTREEWLFNMNLNLESHWNISRLCKPWLEKNKDAVIIINSSSHSYNTMTGCFPYNIAKTALRSLVQSLTIEWGPLIRVLGIAPGFIDTQLSQEWFNSFPDPSSKRLETERLHPLNRLGTPEEIGGWFVFLSSHYAAFAGGQTYMIDGGRSAVMI